MTTNETIEAMTDASSGQEPSGNGETLSSASAPASIDFHLTGLHLEEGERAIPSEDHPGFTEELEMMPALVLPEPRIEAGTELIENLEAIPQKMAFKIGEAADMVGVKQYVLRYWETEFEMLRPRKSKNNQRVYSRKDVETAMMIKKLLYEDRFSIEGARTALRQLKTHVKEERGIKVMAQSQETAVQKLRNLVTEIRRIRDIFA